MACTTHTCPRCNRMEFNNSHNVIICPLCTKPMYQSYDEENDKKEETSEYGIRAGEDRGGG